MGEMVGDFVTGEEVGVGAAETPSHSEGVPTQISAQFQNCSGTPMPFSGI